VDFSCSRDDCALTNPHRLNRLPKKCFVVIPSEARDLLFFAKTKKKQIPRANPALRNDSLRVFPQPLKPAPLETPNPIPIEVLVNSLLPGLLGYS
jgi:hypothetical protein